MKATYTVTINVPSSQRKRLEALLPQAKLVEGAACEAYGSSEYRAEGVTGEQLGAMDGYWGSWIWTLEVEQ